MFFGQLSTKGFSYNKKEPGRSDYSYYCKMKRLLVYTLICIGFCFSEPRAAEPDVDHLIAAFAENPGDTLLVAELIEIINQQLFNEPLVSCQRIQTIIKLLEKTNSESYNHVRLLRLWGITYELRGLYDSAFQIYEKAIKIAEQHKHAALLGDLYNNYSIALAVPGRMEESIEFGLKAKDVFEASGDSAQMAKIYNNLGSRYTEIRFTELALQYYLKAAEINERREDNRRLAYNFGNIGLIYHGLDEHNTALEYFQKSIRLLDTVENRYHYSMALHNLALAYKGLEQYDQALAYIELAGKIAIELNDDMGIMNAEIERAFIINKKGNPHRALEHLNRAENLAHMLGARHYLMRIYEDKANIFSDLKDYRNALELNQKFLAIKDSLLTIEKDKAVQKIKDFEDKRKEQEIEILTKNAEIQKLNAKRQKTIRNSITIVGILLLLLAIGLYSRYRYVRRTKNELAEKNKLINYEKSRSDELLLNILPAETAEELKNTGSSEARHFKMATVMFTDFKGFTQMAEKLSAQNLVSEIDYCFRNFDQIISKSGLEKIKTIGDAYMCAGGLPVPNETNPEDVVRAALEILQFMKDLKEKRQKEMQPFFEIRIGVHTGPVVAGIVGIKKFQYDIWGDTVNIASRMESSGEVGQVNISQTTYELVKDKFQCEHRGKIEAKNKGAIDMYFVLGAK